MQCGDKISHLKQGRLNCREALQFWAQIDYLDCCMISLLFVSRIM